MDANGKKSVADMISVFGGQSGHSSLPRPVKRRSPLPQTKKVIPPLKKDGEDPPPKSSARVGTNDQVKARGSSSSFQKMILVSEKGDVVDETSPRVSRTLGHFNKGGGGLYRKSQNPTPLVIKPMGLQSGYSSYSTDKQYSTLPSQRSRSSSSIVPKKHPGGVVYRKTLTSSRMKSSPSQTSSGNRSIPSGTNGTSVSPGIKQAGGVWFPRKDKPLGVSSTESLGKGGAKVRRSRSFTSHFSVDISPDTNEEITVSKRSSLVIESESVDHVPISSDLKDKVEKRQSPPKPLPKPSKHVSSSNNTDNRMSVRERVNTFSVRDGNSSKPTALNASPHKSVPVSVKKTSIPAPATVKKIDISKSVENNNTNIPVPAPRKQSASSTSAALKQNRRKREDQALKSETKTQTSVQPCDRKTTAHPIPVPRKLTRSPVEVKSRSVETETTEKRTGVMDERELPSSSETKKKKPSSAISPTHTSSNLQRVQPAIALRKTESPVFIPVRKSDRSISGQSSQSVPAEQGGGVKSMIARFSQSHTSPPILKARSSNAAGGGPSSVIGKASTFSTGSESSDEGTDDEEEEEVTPSHRVRILSGKNNDNDLCLDVFDETFEQEVMLSAQSTKNGPSVTTSHDDKDGQQTNTRHSESIEPVHLLHGDGYVSDENHLNDSEVKEGFVESEDESDTFTGDKGGLVVKDHTPSPEGGGDTALNHSPIYSYQEYTLKHRQTRSSSLSTSSLITETPKPLEVIPENDVSIPLNPSPTVNTCSLKPETVGSSSDSEKELVRKMSSVSSMTFYEEVLATINSTIGPATEQVDDQTEHITQVVDEIIRNNQVQKENGSENIYETIEDVRRKVSDFVIRHRRMERESREEVPPELPPRPGFLMKLDGVQEIEEIHVSVLEPSPTEAPDQPYVEMHSSSTVLAELELTDEYEPVNFIPRSPKKKKSPKRNTKKKSPERQEHTVNEQHQRIGSRSGNTRLGIKKKKKHWSLLRSKVEPKENVEKLSSTLPVTEYEVMEFTNSTHKLCTNNYVNVCDHNDMIQPINTSESEEEDPSIMSDVSSNIGSQSPTKMRWRDGGRLHPPQDYPHTMTPDSEMYLQLRNGRYPSNPLTPPLVTKLGIMPSARTNYGLRFSNSDPSLHTTLLVTSRKNNPVMESPSFSHISMDSDEECSQTPSVSSFESGKYTVQLQRSPALRKRIKSDASSDRPSSSAGAMQKSYLLNHTLRSGRGSLPGNAEPETVIEVPLVHADALMDCPTSDPEELSFTVSDVIAVLDMTDDDWWQGMVEDRVGWFPASWVRLRIGQEDSSSLDNVEGDTTFSSQQSVDSRVTATNGHVDHAQEDTFDEQSLDHPVIDHSSEGPMHKRKLSRRMTITKRSTSEFSRRLTPIEVRAKCIEEILTTEKIYVQHLQDIVEGFLEPCEQHGNLFTADSIEAIFSNIREIYLFQQEFLSELLKCVNDDRLQDSQIGQLFMKMGNRFSIYSEYCNNHPHAVNEMNLLHEDPQYTYFFESCRLLRNLTDISLEGFLLTPVQRICRYPLQLSELTKYTPEDHPDYQYVQSGQSVMTGVAMMINDQKKRMEDIGKISLWQETVENWKGPDVLERSTERIHSGELHKISKGHSQERHFFLFDHQMIYCKKDAILGKLSYKGRVDMDKCSLVDLKDGEMSHGGSSVKNAWKMNNADKADKWYVLYAKSSHAKEQWMESFARERERVAEDSENGFVLTPKMKRAAIALSVATSAPIRRRSITKKTQNAVIDTTANNAVGDHLSVTTSQIVLRVETASSNKVISSPNESRKRQKVGKKR